MRTASVESEEKHEANDKRAVYLRTGFGIVISVFRSLFLARLLDPTDMGAYRLGTSWGGYFGFLMLGTPETYYFRAPSLLRMGETEEAQSLRGVALAMVLGASLVTGLGTTILVMALRLANTNTALLFGMSALLSSWGPFLSVSFWTTGQFQRQARVELTVAIVGALFALAGLWLYGLRGLLIGTCLGSALLLWLARDLLSLRDIGTTTLIAFRRSIAFGIRQSTYVFMLGIVASIDLQVFGLLMINQEALGIYSFATMLGIAIRSAATAGAAVSVREMVARHDKRQVAIDPQLCENAEHQRRLDNMLVSLISLSAFGLVVIAAPIAFPSYTKMIEPLAGLILSIVTLRWGFFHSVALSIRSMQWRAMPFAVLGVSVTALGAYVALRLGWSLLAISLAPAIGSAIYSVATVIFCERVLAHRSGWSNISRMLLVLVGQLPILAVRVDYSWYVNGLWVLLAIGATILISLLTDRPTLRATVKLVLMMANRKPETILSNARP